MILKATRFKGNDRLSKAADNDPVLKKGAAGEAVRIVQQALLDLKYKMPVSTKKLGTPDGIYGKETRDRIWTFQSDQLLSDKDGIVGHQTMVRMDKLFITRPVTPRPVPRLPRLSRLQQFLRTDPASAKRLAPAGIVPFPGWTDAEIRSYLVAAVRIAKMTLIRLQVLGAKPDLIERWNSGLEAWWFGEYSDRKYRKVRDTFRDIVPHLTSGRLKVICRPKMDLYGRALPGIRRISLGTDWLSPNLKTVDLDEAERVQTFIHEAAHISGRVSAAEHNCYGRAAAHGLVSRRMKATRNADNYGYYAIDVVGET